MHALNTLDALDALIAFDALNALGTVDACIGEGVLGGPPVRSILKL